MAFLDSVGLWCVAYASGVVMIQPITCLQIPHGVLPQVQEDSDNVFICLMVPLPMQSNLHSAVLGLTAFPDTAFVWQLMLASKADSPCFI